MKTSLKGFRVFLAFVLGAGLLLLPALAESQTSVENAIKQFGETNIQGYMQPLADMFGANMNAGYYHSAAIPQTGFGFSFDIVAMGAMVGDDQRNYSAVAPAGFNPGTFTTATIFGEKGTEIKNVNFPSSTYRGADGVFNTSIFPTAVPQIRIGYLAGTEALVRFVVVPRIGSDILPKSTLWGAGVRHSISQYLSAVPLDLAAGVYYSKYTAGDLIDFTGTNVSIQASKSFSPLSLYGGVAWQKSTLNLKYTSTDPAQSGPVDVRLDGSNKFSVTLGAGLTLGIFHIFADANFGSVTNFAGGIGFGN